MRVSLRLICQYVIRVSCYKNYTRNTQTALVSTLLPVSYTVRCARWTSVCTKLDRRGRDVERHRRARCDGSSAPCSGGPRISPHGCAAVRQALKHRSCGVDRPRTFSQRKSSPWVITGAHAPRTYHDRTVYGIIYRTWIPASCVRIYSLRVLTAVGR